MFGIFCSAQKLYKLLRCSQNISLMLVAWLAPLSFQILLPLCVFPVFVPTHLTVGQLVPGLFPVGEDLPEDHAEAPDVALRGELPVHDALRRHPADRQHRASAHLRRETRQVCNVSSLWHDGSLGVNI